MEGERKCPARLEVRFEERIVGKKKIFICETAEVSERKSGFFPNLEYCSDCKYNPIYVCSVESRVIFP